MKSVLEGTHRGAEFAPPQPPFSFDRLFATASVPILIVDAATDRIVDSNPLADALLRSSGIEVRGARLDSLLETSSCALIHANCASAQESARTVVLQTLSDDKPLEAEVSMFRAQGKCYYLLQLSGQEAARRAERALGTASSILQALDGAPFGFVLTDAKLRIDYTNRVFLDMADVLSPEALIGRSLRHWLRLTEADLLQLKMQLAQRQALTHLTTSLVRVGQNDSPCKVQAVSVPAGTETCWGFCIDLVRRLN